MAVHSLIGGHSVANPMSSVLTPEDVAEYEGRITRLRELMQTRGLDGVVVIDNEGRNSRYLSGFHIAPALAGRPAAIGDRNTVIVVVPLAGEPALIMPVGFLRSHSAAARLRSWIPRIVSTYHDDPEWELKAYWGMYSPETANDAVHAIRESGLSKSRIGLIGTWPGLEYVKAELPQAQFLPATAPDTNGVERNFIDLLTEKMSPWEVAKLEVAQSAADDGIRAFMDAAVDGALYRDVLHAAKYACERTCTQALVFMAVSSASRPWMASHSATFPPDSRFRNGDLVGFEFINQLDEYWVQNCRSWVVGQQPNKVQARVLEATKRALDESLRRLEPGVTGEQMWDATKEILRKADLEPWARMGHPMGFRFFGGDKRFEFLPGNRTGLPADFCLVSHPICIDRATMTSALIGDCVLMTSNGARLLSRSPVSYGTSF